MLDGHKEDCQCEMCTLSRLDKGTEWELDGDMLSDNDGATSPPEDDDGMAGVLAFPHLHPIDGGKEDSLDGPTTADNIVETIKGMLENNAVEDLLVIINTPEGDQHLMCTLDRNDHIIGMLTVATLNWHSSQIASLNYYDEEEGV